MFPMSTDTPKPTAPRATGLGPKAQKLQALREKLEAQKNGGGKQNFSHGNAGGGKSASAGFKKTSFQRKAT
ncbi:hypothetical protein SAMN05444167_1415 [Terriglobus roseus]|uniref:Uncharacterized protein n=2 Tax=Acidobacteriaceae TaxID=204434 RepID=A0A1G7IE79_9BACT|nr:hypothetical protein SAMN05444167_1415 [Terriglobus roseus]